MKTWEILKTFTETQVPHKLKAYVISKEIREDKYYNYKYISLLDGVFYWNSDFSKPFRLNDFYNCLQIEWEVKAI